MQNGNVTILINQRPHHFETAQLEPQDFRDSAEAPADYEVWLVVKDPDAEGQLPVDDVQVTTGVEIKSGQRFAPSSLETFIEVETH